MISRSECEWWAYQLNVEAAWCWLPDIQMVMDGVVSVAALGNDNTRIHILLSADESAACDPDALAQVSMVWLGKALTAVRREEIMAGLP